MKEHRAALKRARRERKLLKKRSPMITHLERELGDLSAVDAVNILCEEFNFGQAQVKFLSGRETTVNNLKAIIAGHNMGAELVGPLMFFGGPPNNAATLYQVLYSQWLWTRFCTNILLTVAMRIWCIDGRFATSGTNV